MNELEHIDVLNFISLSRGLSDQINEFGQFIDAETFDYWQRSLDKVKDLIFTDPLGPKYTPSMQSPDNFEPSKWRFSVGDEVERVDENEWMGLKMGARAIVTEVAPVKSGEWCQLRLAGYSGIYSDFNFKMARKSANV